MEETTEQVKRNPNPTGKGGFGDNPENRNNGGRVPNPFKNYLRQKLEGMTDEEKEELRAKLSVYQQVTLAEGNPAQDLTSGGEKINPFPIYGGASIQTDDGHQEDIPTKETD